MSAGTGLGRSGAAGTGLRGRDFRLLWAGETTSSLGSSVTSIALPLVALTLGADVIEIGVLGAVTWLPWLVIGLPAGAWVDRLPRRTVMIVCDVVSIAAFVSLPVAGWLGVLTLAQLFVVALVAGVATVFFSTAYRTFLPAVVADDELVAANARLQGSASAAQVAGPGVGGVLAQLAGAANAMLIDAVSFVVSLVCLLRMRTDEPRTQAPRRPLHADIGEGLRFVAGDSLLRLFVAFGATANLVLMGYQAVVVVFLVDEVGLAPGVVGLLVAVGSVGGVVGALLAPRLVTAIGGARALLLCKLGAPPFALLIPLTAHDWRLALFVVGETGMVAGIVAGNVVSAGFVQAYAPRALMGRVSTSMQVVNYGAMPLGAVLGGVLADGLGFRGALWLLFGGFVASSLILLFSPLRGARELPTRPQNLSDPAGSIDTRAGRRGDSDGARPRATRGRPGRARPGVHPRGRRNRQDPGDHASHRLRRAQRRGAARSAARGHLHRPRGR